MYDSYKHHFPTRKRRFCLKRNYSVNIYQGDTKLHFCIANIFLNMLYECINLFTSLLITQAKKHL